MPNYYTFKLLLLNYTLLILTKYNLIACINQKGLIAYTFLRYLKKKSLISQTGLACASRVHSQRDPLWSDGELSIEEADWF